MIGVFLPAWVVFRRELAQSKVSNIRRLVMHGNAGSVMRAGGRDPVALLADHLFRTPYLGGRDGSFLPCFARLFFAVYRARGASRPSDSIRPLFQNFRMCGVILGRSVRSNSTDARRRTFHV